MGHDLLFDSSPLGLEKMKKVILRVVATLARVWRGGSYTNPPQNISSVNWNKWGATQLLLRGGWR
jgi:hypothetical protein